MPRLIRILVFADSVESPIPQALEAIERLASERAWHVAAATGSDVFNDETLRDYDVVVWLVEPTALTPRERSSYERFYRSGKGAVAIQSGEPNISENIWPWYRQLISPSAESRGPMEEFTIVNVDASHPATFNWPFIRRKAERWYRYPHNAYPSDDRRVVLVIDDPRFPLGVCYPIAWCKESDGGRYFYTALGGTSEDYTADTTFLVHLTRAIEWAAGILPSSVQRSRSDETLILREFDGLSPNGVWEGQAPSPPFSFDVTATALSLHDATQISLENRHVVRRGISIDPRRPYSIEGRFLMPGPLDPGKHYSFCVNMNVAGPEGDLGPVNTWALPVHILSHQKSLTRLMGFRDGSFFMFGEVRNSWGKPDTEYAFRIHVNADLDGLPQQNLVSRVVMEGAQTVEAIQVDYSVFPYQPNRRESVRLGFNSHGAQWRLWNLEVRYLDVMA